MAKHAIKKTGRQNRHSAAKISTPDSLEGAFWGDSPEASQGKELEDGPGKKYSGPGSSRRREKSRGLFFIPIIILTVIALVACSWLALLSADFSKKTTPYINKYFISIVSFLSFEPFKKPALDPLFALETAYDNDTKTTGKNTLPASESSGSSATAKENSSSKETKEAHKKPSLELQVYERSIYSYTNDTFSYSVKADIKDSKGVSTSKTISVYVDSQKVPETTAPPATASLPTDPPSTTPPTTASSSIGTGSSAATTASGTTIASVTTDTSSKAQSSNSETMGTTTTETTSGDSTVSTTAETAANAIPVANAGGPYTGTPGVNITFDGSASTDPDGSIAEYQWDFGDGAVIINGKMPTHAYTSAGTYAVELKVKDDYGALSTVVTATAIISGETVRQPPANIALITNSTSIIGYTEVSVNQLVSIFISRNSSKTEWAKSLAPLYIQYGQTFNIRADVAWAQMCHETGFLEFTGDVNPQQNNFVGLGATGGGVSGNIYATEELGIIAHYAHLAWYYYPNHINQYCNSTYDQRHSDKEHYRYTGDTSIGFLNGKWAPASTYTGKILLFANQIYGE